MWTLANVVTMLRIALSPVFVALLLSRDSVMVQWSLAVYAIAAVTDYYDGYLARVMHAESRVGKYLDPLADKFLTLAAFVAFIYLDLIPLWMVLIVLGRDIVITLLRSYAEYRDHPFVTMRVAKWKTFLQLTFIFYTLVLLAARHTAWIRVDFGELIDLLLSTAALNLVMLGLTLFTLVTGIMYLIDNRQLLHTLVTEGFKTHHSTEG